MIKLKENILNQDKHTFNEFFAIYDWGGWVLFVDIPVDNIYLLNSFVLRASTDDLFWAVFRVKWIRKRAYICLVSKWASCRHITIASVAILLRELVKAVRRYLLSCDFLLQGNLAAPTTLLLIVLPAIVEPWYSWHRSLLLQYSATHLTVVKWYFSRDFMFFLRSISLARS